MDRTQATRAYCRATIEGLEGDRLDYASQLLASLSTLGPVAASVLVEIGSRLSRGALEYGDDFQRGVGKQDLIEELLDASVYAAVILRGQR